MAKIDITDVPPEPGSLRERVHRIMGRGGELVSSYLLTGDDATPAKLKSSEGEQQKQAGGRKMGVKAVGTSEVLEWPEFKDFYRRLGMDLPLRNMTRSVTIVIEYGALPRVIVETYASGLTDLTQEGEG